jgi:hypothetical protein
MDGLIPFLHATTMPSIRQTGWSYIILACDHHAIHMPKWRTNQSIITSMPQIRQNGRTRTIFARDHHDTHTPKRTNQSDHHYLHATPYAKMDGLIPFLRANAMPTIRQHGGTIMSLPPCRTIRQNEWTYTILARDRHATHTPKCTRQSEHR